MAFSYMQEAIIRDVNGNCRCPFCGMYRKRSDFSDQPESEDIVGQGGNVIHIHVDPACDFCVKE